MSIRIHAIRTTLTESELGRFTQIAQQYYPELLNIRSRLEEHINAGAHVLVAEENGNCLGFSLSSCMTLMTPFYAKEIPLIYQRTMYVDPQERGKLIGIRLQIRALRDHLGPFWLLRRFALMSLTHNPLIVKNFRLYSMHYPNADGSATPQKIVTFIEHFLKLLGGTHIDDTLRISSTFSALKDVDYTHWWTNFLACGHNETDRWVMNSLYRYDQGKVIHTGLSFVMLGYSKPLNFVRRFIEIKLKSLWPVK